MFARNRFPISPARRDDDMLAGMAHAMGCGTLVEPETRSPATAAPVWRPVLLPLGARSPVGRPVGSPVRGA